MGINRAARLGARAMGINRAARLGFMPRPHRLSEETTHVGMTAMSNEQIPCDQDVS